MLGPGKYDDVAKVLRDGLEARGILLMVFTAERWRCGVSVKVDTAVAVILPGLLRKMADEMESDLEKLKNETGEARNE